MHTKPPVLREDEQSDILKNMDFDGTDKRRMEIIIHEISGWSEFSMKSRLAKPVKLNLEPASITA